MKKRQSFRTGKGASMGVWKKTQCTLCGVSCGLEVEVEGTKVVSVR